MTLICLYGTDHKFFIFWKQLSLALQDEQIKNLLLNKNLHLLWRAEE